jgi:hypothetical protein
MATTSTARRQNVAPHEPKVGQISTKRDLEEQIELIRRGMWKVVNEAVAPDARSEERSRGQNARAVLA